jgi:oxygen-dependent protoporphyrinogen oxidase
MKNKKICILGGGLSGLSTAWKKKKEGHHITLIESGSQVGGVLQSEKKNGYLLDYGANTLSLRNQNTSDTLEKMGALTHALDANPKANKRFIVRNQKLVALPLNFKSFFSSPFLSPKGKLRMLLEPFLPKGNLDRLESVADFISRRLGQEALTYCGNPFISGIYASAPETLNLANAFPALYEMEQQHRSLFISMLKTRGSQKTKTRLLSFPDGMQQLGFLIQKNFNPEEVLTNESVLTVTRLAQGWKVKSRTRTGNSSELVCDEVISTIPVDQISNITWENIKGRENFNNLTKVTYFPLSMVFLGMKKESIEHNLDGFGFLVPQKENLSILGTLFSSTLFENRAPEGNILLTTFVGGERMPALALASEKQIYDAVEKDLSKLLGMKNKADFRHIKRWKKSIPLPDLKMGVRAKAAKELSLLNPGLKFSGSAFSGVSLPNCLDADIA